MFRFVKLSAAGVAISLSAVPAFAGPEWVELSTDAGSLPAAAQKIEGDGTLGKISGSLDGTSSIAGGPGDFEDMYLLQIDDPLNFTATTTVQGGGSAEFDAQLWLFKVDGLGLLGNDDTFIVNPPPGLAGKGGIIVSGATLGPMATDNTGQTIPGAGLYLLAISGHFDIPRSDGGFIFSFDGSTEISGPDGAGGTQGITSWENVGVPDFNGLSLAGATGAYTISLTGTSQVPADILKLALDIKPGGCPNSFNRSSNGVLPVSLLGTPTFDVHTINKSTVVISRADGVGGSVHPHEGPPGPHSVYSDTGTPFEGEDCECSEDEGDGITDLSMKFVSQEVVTALQLNGLPAGSLVPLNVTGLLTDGTAFTSTDCIRLVPPGTPPGLLSMQSTVGGSYIEVNPPDLQLDTGGFANFQRTYPQSTLVTLTAPSSAGGHAFVGWMINGVLQPPPPGDTQGESSISVVVSSTTQTVKAVYSTGK